MTSDAPVSISLAKGEAVGMVVKHTCFGVKSWFGHSASHFTCIILVNHYSGPGSTATPSYR